MSHLHLNELLLICDMWVNKITYLLTYLLKCKLSREIYKMKKPAGLDIPWSPTIPQVYTIMLN